MSASIPVLWSDDIKVDVVSPLAILRAQLDPLRAMTKGLLEAEIESRSADRDGLVEHRLFLVAPSLSNYRHELLGITHQKDFVYPVTVVSPYLLPGPGTRFDPSAPAESDEAFIELLGRILRSTQVRAVIHALLARINEESHAEGG